MRRRIRMVISFILICILVFFAGCGKNKSPILEFGVRNNNLANEIIILDEKAPTSDDMMFNLPGQCFSLINSYRQMNGLPELRWSPALEECAAIRAEEASEYWSHSRPSGKPWYTVNSKIMRGENLAMGYTSAEDIVNNWINSPAHNELLLADDFTYIAIAEYNGYYACEFT